MLKIGDGIVALDKTRWIKLSVNPCTITDLLDFQCINISWCRQELHSFWMNSQNVEIEYQTSTYIETWVAKQTRAIILYQLHFISIFPCTIINNLKPAQVNESSANWNPRSTLNL